MRPKVTTERASCTIHALSAAAGIPHIAAYEIATEAGKVNGRGFKSHLLIEQAKKHGLSFRKLRMKPRTLARFIREHPVGRFYVRKTQHAFAVVDGMVHGVGRNTMGSRLLDAWQLQEVPRNA